MRRVSQIRDGLGRIPGCIKDFPPEPGFRGEELGVTITPIWRGDYEEQALSPDKSFSDSEEEDENDGTPPEFDPVIEIGADVDETFPALEGEAGEEIRRSVLDLDHGMDAYGWYVPFHYPGVQWGIYIPVTGIVFLIRDALSKLPSPFKTKRHLAFHAILNHELFHFGTDYAIAQAELLHQEPWYVPAKTAFKKGTPDYCVIEEQLANAYMLKAFRTMKPALKVRGKQEALREFTKKQPEGYRDGHLIKSSYDWDRCLTALAQEYGWHSTRGAANPLLWESGLGFDWPGQFPRRPRIDWRYCPIYYFNDGARLGIPPDFLSFFGRIPAFVESERFLKRLRNMPDSIQRAWERTKSRLAVAITRGARLEEWDKGSGVYSVRLNDNYRAHIQRPNVGYTWTALDLGTHKEMGHG